MNNDYSAHGDRQPAAHHERDRQRLEQEPLTDREVPLGLARTPAAVHQWLDGDLSEGSVRQGEMVRHVEFWNRVGVQAEARRQMRTPAHLTAQIMSALPEGTPRTAMPWWRRRIEMTPALVAAAGVTVLAFGYLVGVQLAR